MQFADVNPSPPPVIDIPRQCMGLKVAMHDLMLVHVRECAADLSRDLHRIRNRQRSDFIRRVVKRLTL